MAAAVACLAEESLVRGTCIEPEVSTMITSAVDPADAAETSGAAPAGAAAPDAVTVMIALTSVDPTDRYSFWYTSTSKSGAAVMYGSSRNPVSAGTAPARS